MAHQVLLVFFLFFYSINNLPCYGNPEATLRGRRANPVHHGAPKYHHPRLLVDSLASGSKSSQGFVNVLDYGAKGDGKTDDTQAFAKAWSRACSSSASVVLRVPRNKNYLLKPITFSGPCKSTVSVMIEGTIAAPSYRSAWNGKNGRQWIVFRGVNNLVVGGGGTINGNGQIWWQNSCKIDTSKPCKVAPTALTFSSCNELVVENLKVKNSQQIHMSFERCNGVTASHLTINAPEESPNTDGIHVAGTKNMEIDNCVIGTGDDCISIETGSHAVKATNIVCGPGHGISIGSLGDGNSAAQVSDVTIDTAQLKGTTNGVRIKTYQGGSGYAKDIVFQNIAMSNVQNPIIIDQNYCDSNRPCRVQKSAVQVSDVVYKNIKGTSASDVAITLDCSKTVPCKGITLQNINLAGNAEKTSCENVKWTKSGTVIPQPCA